MPSSKTCLRRLEAHRLAVADLPSTPPEPPPGWCEEVLRLLRDSGDPDDTLRSWGLTEADMGAALLGRRPSDVVMGAEPSSTRAVEGALW